MNPARLVHRSSALFLFGIIACGSESVEERSADSALIGGDAAESSQFPSLLFFSPSNCTGMKVGPKTVLTAAHCLFNPIAREVDLRPGDKFQFTRDPAAATMDEIPIA